MEMLSGGVCGAKSLGVSLRRTGERRLKRERERKRVDAACKRETQRKIFSQRSTLRIFISIQSLSFEIKTSPYILNLNQIPFNKLIDI